MASPSTPSLTGGTSQIKWVKVTRSGSTFSGYYSTDGTTWTQIGSNATVTMGTGALGGLAVTAHDNSQLATATFDQVQAAGGGHATTFSHDAAGNQTQVTDPYGVTTYYAWDALGQMSLAQVPAGTLTMTYNAHGQRVQKTSTDGSITNFLFDHKRLLHETDGSDDPTKSYTNLDEEYGDLLSTFDETGTPTEFYHQFDAQHSTNALIDPDCDVVQTYKYQAFGLPAGNSDVGWANLTAGEWAAMDADTWAALPADGAQTDIRFAFGGQAGYSYETELGLYLLGMGGNGQRLMNPATGRFTSEDSIRQAGGTLNLYQYERNDPLVNVDPGGKQDEPPGMDVAPYQLPIPLDTPKDIAAKLKILFLFERGNFAHRLIQRLFAPLAGESILRDQSLQRLVNDFGDAKAANDYLQSVDKKWGRPFLESKASPGAQLRRPTGDPLLNERIRASEVLDPLSSWKKLERASDASLLRVDITIVKGERPFTLGIYEIKPDNANGLAAAEEDVSGYLAVLTGAGIKTEPGPSNHPWATNKTPILTPFGMLTWRSPNNGIILYKFERPQDEERRKEVAKAYAPIREKLREAKERLQTDAYLRSSLAIPMSPNARSIQPAGMVDPGILEPVYDTLGPFVIVTDLKQVGAKYMHVDPRTRQIYISGAPIDAADVSGQRALEEAMQDAIREAAANQRAAEAVRQAREALEEVP